MQRLFRKRRRAFTLIEVALAGVVGAVLLSSIAYSTNEMRRAVNGVYNETLLQTVVRDLQGGLEKQLPGQLSTITNANTTEAVNLTMQDAALGNMTAQLGSMRFRWVDGVAGSANTGGELALSSDGGSSWSPLMGLGSRDMLDRIMFAYDNFVTAEDASPPAGSITFAIDSRVRDVMVRVTARLAKDDMVPLYLQEVFAPRSPLWSWTDIAGPTAAGGVDTDGDGTNDDIDAYPWDRTRTQDGLGGLMPIAMNESTVSGAAPNTVVNLFQGGGSGNFGWLTWNGVGNTGTLAGMIADPTAYPYNNPNDATDHAMDLGDWVTGNTGVDNSDNIRDVLDTKMGVECTVMVWNQFLDTGSNATYNTVGYAKIRLDGYNLPRNQITATFRGLCDRQGNLYPGVASGVVATATSAPVAVAAATPAPEATATPAPEATATPSPSATASPIPTVDLMPFMLHEDLVPIAMVNPTDLGVKTAGTGTTNWAWCSWDNTFAESELATSLVTPGNSEDYTSPDSASDHHIDIGDKITGAINVGNDNTIRTTLDGLVSAGTVMVVPLYNASSSSEYTVSGFCKIQLTVRAIYSDNPDNMTFTYLGRCNADGSAP